MASDEIPHEVRRLLHEHISSVEQLEILLLLKEQAPKEWSVKDVYEELRSGVDSTLARLGDLAKRGFLVSREEGDETLYRYAPSDSALDNAVSQLQAAYSARRYRIIEVIFSKPIDNLRVYAQAFKFRKDKSDG